VITRLTERYGCRHPFVGAGMAFACEPSDLAVAVIEAGGIGAISGFQPPEHLRQAIRDVRERVDGPFHVNLLAAFPNEEQVAICAAEQVPIVSFHWGHPPAELLATLHDAGVSVWEQVGSVEAARRAVDDGVEAVVAQGAEAGGHNFAELPTFVQLPSIVDAVGRDALVLAAGGVVDGRQAAAAFCLGADAVWVGTALLAAPEANVHPEHRRRLVQAGGADAVLTSIFGPEWPDFNPMRVLRNRVVAEYGDRLDQVPADRSSLEEIGSTRFLGQEIVARKFESFVPVPETTGDFEEMPWLSGQGVGLVQAVRPAAEIVATMMYQAEAVLSCLGAATVPR